VYASGCAVARAFPVYSRKTDVAKANTVVTVEFVCPAGGAVTEEELKALSESARAIQLAARIVDTPCNEMHTDAFIEVRFLSTVNVHDFNFVKWRYCLLIEEGFLLYSDL
jgi:hypothetical protein